MSNLVAVIIVIVIIGIPVLKIVKAIRKKKAEILAEQAYQQALISAKNAYDEALNGTDKRDALQKGRQYYALLRGGIAAFVVDLSGSLTPEDEARINTDLNSMNV